MLLSQLVELSTLVWPVRSDIVLVHLYLSAHVEEQGQNANCSKINICS